MLQKYSSYVLCFLIAIFVVTLYVNNFSPLVRLEWKIQDLLYSFRGDDNFSQDIVQIEIDEPTLREYGEWPWHRDRLADLVAAVGSGEPRVILLDILFEADTHEDTSGYTAILAGQLSWIKNMILPYEISPAEFMNTRMSNPKYLYQSSIQVNNELGVLDENATLMAHKVFLPPDILCEYASGLGFKHSIFDKDRKVRWEPMAMYYDGYYYPSVSLLTAATYLGIPPSSIKIYGGEYIQMGGIQIPINNHAEFFINYNKPGRSFNRISAVDLLADHVKPNELKDKLAIISITSEYISDFYRTPVSDNLAAAEKTANVIENIIHSNFISRYDSSPMRDTLLLIGLGLLFAFILPRVSIMYRLIILLASLFILANLNFVLFNSYKILTPSLYFCLELAFLLLASPFLDEGFLARLSSLRISIGDKSDAARLPKVDLSEANMAPVAEPISKPKNRQEKPARIFETKTAHYDIPSATAAPNTVGVMSSAAMETRIDKPETDHLETAAPATIESELAVEQPDEPVPAEEKGSGGYAPLEESEKSATIDSRINFGSDSNPIRNLGRYKIVGNLGKGAMGMVYKGTDPAINRNVALKTIRLDFVNDPEELEELKERLFREARAAGNLSHPNIVTIYDVGNEGNLQYIAMEYLEGQTLEEMIRRKAKFNFRIISQIITQICSALDYAHNQGIVHRDIKPANIMVLKDYQIKVMDFGIARVDSSSMTRTGIAMGTPNYISPEQLQGKPVDRRCDIFSLGVVMYEMLLQRRPFRGENLTALIYDIVNKNPETPSSVNNSIPHIFDRIIDKALKKNPAERFQTAKEVSTALADFLESFASKRTTMV
nr:CHASE2 domain-containing protein [candidate division Zixibacteria bacterium]